MADTWTMLNGYSPTDYEDTLVFGVNPETKELETLRGQTLVAGEDSSQYIRFEMDRYWDGIDVSTKELGVTYFLAGTYFGSSEGVSAEVTDTRLRFGWIVPKEACCISGTLMFCLTLSSDSYVLKTKIAETPVARSLTEDSVIPEPSAEAWYREFRLRMQADIDSSHAASQAAQTAVENAEIALIAANTANENAQAAVTEARVNYGSPLIAEEAADMVDTNRVYVYTGTEYGYSNGNWYYYNGNTWTPGGVYTTDTSNWEGVVPMKAIVDVSKMVDRLSSDNIEYAIGQALTYSDMIYIPAGTYDFNVALSQDCTIYLDDDCYISTSTSTPCITATDCSVKIYGGNATAGENDSSKTPVFWGSGSSFRTAIISLSGCENCVIKDLKSPWSKYVGVIRMIDCKNVLIENCSFENALHTAISMQDHNENITVRGCSIVNVDKIEGHDYCYAVCTGMTNFTNPIVPIEGLIYENNYVYDTEDSGLDTHGASNLIIRNNRIYQTVCAITAYNDNMRGARANDWTMRNILIENNYCESDKVNEAGRQYPHAFVFLGATNVHTDSDSGYENNPGSYYAFCNCVVQNNYFKSPNNYQAIIYLDNVSRDVLIQNNVIDCMNSARPLNPNRAINIRILNNSIRNCNQTLLFTSCLGEVANNSGVKYDLTLSKPSCIVGCKGDHRGTASPLINSSVSISIDSNGVATLPNHDFIPGLALRLSVGIVYVHDVIDMKHFVLVKANGEAIPAATYTAEFMTATVVELS